MEVLNDDVVSLILERVPVKSLVRFKSVSKQWESTIKSNNFQERQLIHRKQSPYPDLLFLTSPTRHENDDYDDDEDIPSSSSFSFSVDDNDDVDDDDDHIKIISSSSVTLFKIPMKKRLCCSNSCDGLVCLYNVYENIVINPTTRWHRNFPLSNLQQQRSFASLGFGKDKFSGVYKSVWLYSNTREIHDYKNAWRKNVTTCEVFDFRVNAWRYVTLATSSYDIISYIKPVYVDGSIHWMTTKNELETEVLSFDLHTETFQVIAKTPFDRVAERRHYMMCNLNNRLCVSEVNYPNQVIWLFDSGSKTWNHMFSIDLDTTYYWFRKSTKDESGWHFGNCIGSLVPEAVLEEKNGKTTKVLFSFYIYKEKSHLVIYDGQTESFELACTFSSSGWCPKRRIQYFGYTVCYFQSLISIL